MALVVRNMLSLDFMGRSSDPVPGIFGPVRGLELIIELGLSLRQLGLYAHGLSPAEKALAHGVDLPLRGDAPHSVGPVAFGHRGVGTLTH